MRDSYAADTYRCSGGCGKTVDGPEKWCPSCFPVSVSTDRDLRFKILHAAYKLAFGTRDERKLATETLSHLITELKKEEK